MVKRLSTSLTCCLSETHRHQDHQTNACCTFQGLIVLPLGTVPFRFTLCNSVILGAAQNSMSSKLKHIFSRSILIRGFLRYDLTDTAGVLENRVLGMFHGLDDWSVLVEGF